MNKNIISILIGMIIVVISFIGGCTYHKKTYECPVTTNDTIKISDPYWHHIADSLAGLPPKEKIKWLPSDTLYTPSDTVFKNADTLAILRDYYSVFQYTWNKIVPDTAVFKLTTTITKNKPIKYELDYKFIQPFTTVINNTDNSVHYNRYINLGLSIPFKDASYATFNAIYATEKYYAGVGYNPKLKSLEVSAGVPIIKFKIKK
jgi:hypothetical protein